ncbi:type VI secretion system ATPase TssH [Pseudomonas sp. Marseille-Q5115]|uniref:type VI secretion system ATPase TssH n=1 Tax=Pseudomonas sp. Marseille-Q5115 TaxID=2866593 RepID=UPI001CE40130|nr:type VI secretion system ATPase TssH [Pseudomonas sp. Marseille-Q5115]
MNLKSLFAKLNDTARRATESAAALCLSERHYDVEVEHLLLQLLERDDNDLPAILRRYDILPERLQAQLLVTLGTFKVGNTRTPALSSRLTRMIEQAWLLASIEFSQARIRTAHLLLAVLSDAQLQQILLASAPVLSDINVDDLRANLAALMVAGAESQEPGADVSLKGNGKTPALDQYTINLTERARAGGIDPVLGRELEVRQIVDILTRRRQNNPILTGEAGVGKTAVVEGLALRIARSEVPAVLKDVAIHTLDLGLLQAGAGVKGEFENRLKSVIEETKRSLHPIILFIDEAHTLIGAGGQAGQNDAANLLKPALARGELRTIAATTWAEYKKYFEKDAALARRFQVVKVEEPDEDSAVHMLRGLLTKMQEHHKVTIMDEALVQAVRLSNRYITGRQLPDKAVSVLDTACARVALAQAAQPWALEDCNRRLDNLEAEIAVLQQESTKGSDHGLRLLALEATQQSERQACAALEKQWQQELELVRKLNALGAQARCDPRALEAVKAELASVQGECPLVHALVDGNIIGEVISGWTGIPLGKMLRDDLQTVQQLPALLGERVLGQDHALQEISKRIKISRARMEDPNKPIGVFLLLGPSGVGKTETALALADILYGGERNLITINMSEYQEAHMVSSLKGSPPGYVGYGEGGVLTEAVRRKPYSVVLLDEVEKAHPDVLELFFQLFDKGVLDDGEGREINFRNTVILLTSNLGTEHISQACIDPLKRPTPAQLLDAVRNELNHVFKPPFLGRLTVVPYYPVQDAVLERIVELKMQRIAKRFNRNHQGVLSYGPGLIKAITARCTEVDSGARAIDNILSGTLMPDLAQRLLEHMALAAPIHHLSIEPGSDGDFAYHLA